MISQLRGTIIAKEPPQLMLDVQAIGYEIDATMNTFYHLPDIGNEVTVFTHLVVREDAHLLYGFYNRDERSLFRHLLKMNGVGPRLALTILSSIDPTEFVQCVMNNDISSLVRLPGVGKKTAERLVIEMRDKLAHWHLPQPTLTRQPVSQDAVAALIALGYKPQEASKAIAKVDDGKMTSEDIIRRALQEMV